MFVRASAADPTTFREFVLGSSVAAVRAVATAPDHDLFVMHDRPAVLQVLEWRLPRPTESGPAPEAVREMVFSFIDGKLYRIAVAYDEARTAGLTRAAMTAALDATYGVRSPSIRAIHRTQDPLDAAPVVAQWQREDAMVSLQYIHYIDAYRLLVTSVPLEQAARTATAAARALEAREASARRAAARKRPVEIDRIFP